MLPSTTRTRATSSSVRIGLAGLLAVATLVFGMGHCCHAAGAAPGFHAHAGVAEAACAACFTNGTKLAAAPARTTDAPSAGVRTCRAYRAESPLERFHDRASPPRAPPA